MVDALVSMKAAVCAERGILDSSLDLALADDVSLPSVEAVRWLFSNLLDNACQRRCGKVPEGARFIKLKARVMRLSGSADGEQLRAG